MFRLRPFMKAVKNVQVTALMKDSVKAMNTTTLNIPEVPDYNISKPQTLEKRKARKENLIDLVRCIKLITKNTMLCATQCKQLATSRKFYAVIWYNFSDPSSYTYILLYQSRKRGMLENDLLLSTFVKLYLEGLTEEQTIMYDRLINGPFSDWDIYYWIVEKQPTPKEYDNEIMDMLKKHAKNEKKVILSQPELF